MSLAALRDFVKPLAPGLISETSKIKTLSDLLAESWDCLVMHEGSGMEAFKLAGRMESVAWDPPNLSFTIERHGGTVMGSRYAELQGWSINIDTAEADFSSSGRRAVRPAARHLDLDGTVADLVRLIETRKTDDRLEFTSTGVKVIVSRVIPEGPPKQTVAGRRKRFRDRLITALKANWKETSRYHFVRLPDRSSD